MTDLDRFRAGKAYTPAQAARLAGTSAATVRRWVLGYAHGDRSMAPVFGEMRPKTGEPVLLSFLELAEVIVAARFTRAGGKLQKVRDARAHAAARWPELPYPFASLRLKMLGGELLHEFDEMQGGSALALSASSVDGEQWILPGMVSQALDLFDFDETDEMATRWFPAGRGVPIVIDPHYGGGQLTVADRGVRVDLVRRRFFDAGQSLEFIAGDLEIESTTLERIIQLSEPAA